MFLSAPNFQLPWTSSEDDNRRLKKILGILMVPALIVSIAIPLIDVPEPDREELEELPPQLADLIIEEEKLPPPTPTPTPEPKKETPKPEATPEPKTTPKPTPKATPKPKATPPPAQVQARKAAEAEINQIADDLSALRESFTDLEDLGLDLQQTDAAAETVERSIITGAANQKSQGINTASLNKNTGGGIKLGDKSTTRVVSKIPQTGGNTGGTGSGKTAAKASSGGGFRSDEEVRKILERHKGAIFQIYNRELNKNPTLEGKVVFKIVIEPNGRVAKVEIVSSDLGDPKLERKLMAKIRSINFGAKGVKSTTVNYALDFLPY